MNKKMTAEIVMYAVCIVFTLWIVASFVNANAHNLTDGHYAAWNMFTILF